MGEVRIIGVDVATQPKNVGLALGSSRSAGLELEDVRVHRTWPAIDAQLSEWIRGCADEHGEPTPTLLALDAPLGWPARLSAALPRHRAGEPAPENANALFRRQTDDVVAAELGKRPLDVGADRIARTAHAALGLLGRLRRDHAIELPLAWEPGRVTTTSAIEVYPAGTLASRRLPSSGYKGTSEAATAARTGIIDLVRGAFWFDEEARKQMHSSDHLLDAALCCLAARDFLEARVLRPTDEETAIKEGWIWVRHREGSSGRAG